MTASSFKPQCIVNAAAHQHHTRSFSCHIKTTSAQRSSSRHRASKSQPAILEEHTTLKKVALKRPFAQRVWRLSEDRMPNVEAVEELVQQGDSLGRSLVKVGQ
jgi:hypothetical protein